MLTGEIDVMEDRAQEPRRNIFAAMDRDNRRASISMPHVEMAAPLSDGRKSKTLEDTDKLERFEDRKFTHEGTLTCWTPTH